MPTAPHPLRTHKPRGPAASSTPVVHYPDWGVEPMTPIHRRTTNDIIMRLEDRYRDRADVCVGGDMTMYYREGDNRRAVMPDVFVAFGPSRDRERTVWKVWEEGRLADFVLEVASKSTHPRDQTTKVATYRSLGVAEYWQHDPTGKFLPATLIGRRLAAGAYAPVPLETKPDGTLYGESKVLALHLCLDARCLRLFDPATGEFLPTHDEHVRTSAETKRELAEERRLLTEERRRHAEERRLLTEERRRHAEERRALLAEIEALKRRQAHP